jgi:hypothetical protein
LVIDPNWALEDLDPRTWRAIGRFFMPDQYIAAAQPGEHGLFVLHDDGARPRVVDSRVGRREDLSLSHVDDAGGIAKRLYRRGDWDRVHVINRRHLAQVAAQAQSTPRRDVSIDAYYHLVYSLIWDGSDGYVAEPPHPGSFHGWSYERLLQWMRSLPSPCALGLCVLEQEDGPLHIGLAARVEGGRIVRVTTLEGLPPLAPRLDRRFLDEFGAALNAALAPAGAALVCTRPVFEAWITGADKRAILQSAAEHKLALWIDRNQRRTVDRPG